MAVSDIRERNVLVANLASLWNLIGFVLFTSHMFGANSKHSVFSKLIAMALESFYVGTIGEALHKRRSWPLLPGKFRVVSIP